MQLCLCNCARVALFSSSIGISWEKQARGSGWCIEIINNTRGGIQSKIWERANGGQIQVPDVLNNENCTVHPNIELSVSYFQSIRDLNLPPISALPFTTNVSGTNAPSSVIYKLYGLVCLVIPACPFFLADLYIVAERNVIGFPINCLSTRLRDLFTEICLNFESTLTGSYDVIWKPYMLMLQFPMTMYLAAGTQSASSKQNFLIVLKMSDLQEMEEEQSNNSWYLLLGFESTLSIMCSFFSIFFQGDEEDVVEDEPDLIMGQIKHNGAVNRVRVCCFSVIKWCYTINKYLVRFLWYHKLSRSRLITFTETLI